MKNSEANRNIWGLKNINVVEINWEKGSKNE